jgi:hypothetical protein
MIVATVVAVWATSLVTGALFALGGTIAITGKPPFTFIARRGYSTGEWRLWGLCYVVVTCALALYALVGGLFMSGVGQSPFPALWLLQFLALLGFFGALGLIDQHHHRRWPFRPSRRGMDVLSQGPH